MFHHNEEKYKPFYFDLWYKGEKYKITCKIEYESTQIMRISLKRKKTILLENNYPFIKNSKMAIKWKIKIGSQYLLGKPDLFAKIIRELETHIKKAST